MHLTRRDLMNLSLMLGASGLVAAQPPAPNPEVPGMRAPLIPRLDAGVPFGEWLAAFHAQPPTESGLDSCLPVVFHGSPTAFERVEPYPSKRGTRTLTRWQGTAMFATADPRVGLFYTNNRRLKDFSCGINLIEYTPPNMPLTFFLSGGKSRDEALDALYASPTVGYVYVLSKQFFYREPGLGTMECVSRDPESNLWRLEVNRRQEIENLLRAGRIRIDWA